MKRFGQLLFALVVCSFAGFNLAQAQTPDKMFGLGVFTSGDESSGFYGAYALSPAVHIGAGFGLRVLSAEGNDRNDVNITPFVRFLLAGTSTFKPTIMAGFAFQSIGGTSNNALVAAVGGLYYPTATVGIGADFNVIEIGLSEPTFNAFGLIGGRARVEWFFK